MALNPQESPEVFWTALVGLLALPPERPRAVVPALRAVPNAREQGDWALVKDNAGSFTGRGKSIAWFQSRHGLAWSLVRRPFVIGTELIREHGTAQRFHSLERPQLFFENGQPTVLLLAADEDPRREHSYNVRVPLTPSP